MTTTVEYVRIPGTAMRYYVVGTGTEISRREYIKRTEGISPEEKAVRRVEQGKAKPGITYKKYKKRYGKQEKQKPKQKREIIIGEVDGIDIHQMPTAGERGVSQLVGYYRFRHEKTGTITVSKGFSTAILTHKRPSYYSAEYHILSMQAQENAVARFGEGNYGWKLIGIDDEYWIDW